MSYEIRRPLTVEQIMAHDGKLPTDQEFVKAIEAVEAVSRNAELTPESRSKIELARRGSWSYMGSTYAKSGLACEIVDLVRDLDDYEATIALAYIKRLIKSREGRQQS